MASLTHSIHGNFDSVVRRVTDGVLNASVSASLEDSWETSENGARCAVRIFELYSYAGGNRVSMSVTFFQTAGPIRVYAATSGGSQAVFFKINTWGEESFLDTLQDVLHTL